MVVPVAGPPLLVFMNSQNPPLDDPKVREGLIGALTDYTTPYTKGCTPPSSTRCTLNTAISRKSAAT